MKNNTGGSEEPLSTAKSEVWSMAYDYGRKKIFWTGLRGKYVSNYNIGSNGMRLNRLIYEWNLGKSGGLDGKDQQWNQVPVTRT